MKELMLECEREESTLSLLPRVLEAPSSLQAHVFGKLSREHFELWRELCLATGSQFDLLYAPRAWQCLLQSWAQADARLSWDDWSILYVCSGGAEGNRSMLRRYLRAGLVLEDEVPPTTQCNAP
jgi:1-aminocyclopropane-1-carboxylate deaminase/D-cysteine desulfhydrase-like pyridoxal-dependent ACC family enzyme